MRLEFKKLEGIYNDGTLKKKLVQYNVKNKEGELLGNIYFDNAWKKFVFWPVEAKFDASCLSEIIHFLKELGG